MATWYTVEEAQDDWADWPRQDDDGTDLLSSFLAAAKYAVLAYAPVLTSTAPAPVTITSAPWTVDLAGSGDRVQATITVAETLAGSSITVAIPADFQPAGRPLVLAPGGVAQAYFEASDAATLYLVSNPQAGQTFEMYWTAATPSVEDDIPDGWRIAQLLQARNIWNSGKATPTGDFDGGQYSLTTFPLDWQVRQLIRPKRGVPVIG